MKHFAHPSLVALACGLLLAACGGGSSSDTSADSLSQPEATADAANATQTGAAGTSGLDAVFDSAQAVTATTATASPTTQRAAAAATATPVSGVVVACAGGGSATLTITGGTPATQANGVFDTGEHYSLWYAQCRGGLGLAQLDGQVEMDIIDASATQTTATLTLTKLSATSALGTVTLDGDASLARATSTAGAVVTASSQVSASNLSMATAFNARSGSFTLTDVDLVRTVTTTAGVTSGSQIAGHHTLTGDANGFVFSLQVSTVGSVSYDAAGTPAQGQWTTLRPGSTVVTTVADGGVTLTLDIGNDGTIDRTWTFPVAQLDAGAG